MNAVSWIPSKQGVTIKTVHILLFSPQLILHLFLVTVCSAADSVCTCVGKRKRVIHGQSTTQYKLNKQKIMTQKLNPHPLTEKRIWAGLLTIQYFTAKVCGKHCAYGVSIQRSIRTDRLFS